ncbi:MAG: STAS domain-containing protein [Planctomycetota bacterium]|nr:STAS domain-containing protein [Planctomycetota bacterium]
MKVKTKHLRAYSKPGVIIIDLLDDHVIDHCQIYQIGNDIYRIMVASNQSNLIINFKIVDHLSSTFLSVLVALMSKMRKRGGVIRIAGLSKGLQHLFKMTKLDHQFPNHENVDSALVDLPLPLAQSA